MALEYYDDDPFCVITDLSMPVLDGRELVKN
jgi:CheY-like chemotaxis protein